MFLVRLMESEIAVNGSCCSTVFSVSCIYLLELISFCHSFPLISRYLAGDASDSDSGEENSGDEDDDEPDESSMRE